jgi:hypothetical protein
MADRALRDRARQQHAATVEVTGTGLHRVRRRWERHGAIALTAPPGAAATGEEWVRLTRVRSWICGSRLRGRLRVTTVDIRVRRGRRTTLRPEGLLTAEAGTRAEAIRDIADMARRATAGRVAYRVMVADALRVAEDIIRRRAAEDIPPAAGAPPEEAVDTLPAADIRVVAAILAVGDMAEVIANKHRQQAWRRHVSEGSSNLM